MNFGKAVDRVTRWWHIRRAARRWARQRAGIAPHVHRVEILDRPKEGGRYLFRQESWKRRWLGR
jgi:hypothetical protein